MPEKESSRTKKNEYLKKRSRYTRHIYKEQTHVKNKMDRERRQERSWKEYNEKIDALKWCIKTGAKIPDHLKNIKKPKIYKEKEYVKKICPSECILCRQAKIFLKIEQ
jgi:hypothetical protein